MNSITTGAFNSVFKCAGIDLLKSVTIVMLLLLMASQIAQSAPQEILWQNTKTVGTDVQITSPISFTTCDISPDGGSGWDTCYAYLEVTNNLKDITALESSFEAIWKTGNVRNVRYEYTKDVVASEKVDTQTITSEPDLSKGETQSKEEIIETITPIKNIDNLDLNDPSILLGETIGVKITFEKQRWTTASFDFKSVLAGSESLLDPEIGACGSLSVDGATYTLNQSVNSSGSCITISGSNITLDGAGYMINYSTLATGKGIYVSSSVTERNNITIKNIIVNKANTTIGINAEPIQFYYVNDSIIKNSSFITYQSNGSLASALIISNSRNITITNNTAINGYSAHGIDIGKSNNISLINNTGTSNTGYGIRLSSSSNNTLTSNTGTSDTSNGIRLNSSSNNTLTSNTGTSDTSYGFFITASHYNTFSNNTGSSNGDGGLQLELSNFNTFLNNTFFTYGGTTIEDLSVDRSYKNNTFRNTNWSTYRKLKFYIALDEFNQSQNSGITWVNTNVTTASIVNRSILNWEQTDIILDETWNGANTVRYTASGLLPNVYYSVMNYSTLTTWTEKLVATDANGLLPEQVINFSTTQKYVRFLFNESATFILAPIGAKTLSTSSKSFTISASCPLGCSGPIVYSTTATLGSIDSATGIYTINASQLTTGEFNWVFSATDGNYSDSETIHVSMNSMLTAGGYNTMQKTSGNTNKGLELASLVALVLAAMLIIGIVIGMGTGVIDGKTAIITITTIVMFGIVVLFMIIINDSIANL